MIKKLDIYDTDLLNNSDDINQFCKVFSNLEQLTCTIRERHDLLFLLQHLSKLRFINVHSESSTFRDDISWLEEETRD
jgi:hypothetical protein